MSPRDMPIGAPGGAAHPGDLLSGLVDGELSPGEVAHVHAHLDGCPHCRAELGRTEAARRLVRELPLVEPPFGFYERLQRPRARVARSVRGWGVAANVVATAAAWLVVLAVTSGVTPISASPPVDNLVARHTATALPLPTDATFGTDEVPEPSPPPADVDYPVPVRLGVFVLSSWAVDGTGLQARYTNGLQVVSLFEQIGRLDWDELPATGERTEVDGGSVWMAELDSAAVVLTERDGIVYALVGDRLATLSPLLGDLPEPAPPSLGDRLRAAGDRLVDAFSLG